MNASGMIRAAQDALKEQQTRSEQLAAALRALVEALDGVILFADADEARAKARALLGGAR